MTSDERGIYEKCHIFFRNILRFVEEAERQRERHTQTDRQRKRENYLTLRNILRFVEEASREWFNFLHRSSNRNSSCGAWMDNSVTACKREKSIQ